MPDLSLPASGISGQTGLLLALIVIVGLLFVGTVGLSVYALIMRALHRKRDERFERLSEEWLEPVLAAVADPTLVPSVQKLIRKKDSIHFLGFVIEYVRRLRGSEREVLRELAQPFLASMVSRAHAGSTEMRAWAVQVLGTLGLPRYEAEVIAALDDPSPLVAMVAGRALARKETPQYASAVLARLHRFSGWNRMFLASMLASMGPDVSDALRAGLADESVVPGTRAVMAEALLLQGDFRSGDIAADIVASTDDRELLASALRLLAGVGRPEHADVVRPLCASDDPAVRSQALRALGPLGGRGDVAVLIEAMDDPDPWPALYAARGARDAGGREVLADMASSGDRKKAALAAQVLDEDREG